MKFEIITLLVSLCSTGDIEMCPGVIMKTQDSNAVAQHAVAPKSGNRYILVNPGKYDDLSNKHQKQTLVHELAHDKVHTDHGVASHNHGKKFKRACMFLVEKTNVSNNACKSSI